VSGAVAQLKLDAAIDAALDALEQGAEEGVELDPLQTIFTRLRERGQELDLAGAPPLVRMLLEGALGE